MIAIYFHHELYDGFAIDEAVKVYAPFADAALAREASGYVVRLTALAGALEQGIDEQTIAAELANYALGKTIEKSIERGGAAMERGGAAMERGEAAMERGEAAMEGGR